MEKLERFLTSEDKALLESYRYKCQEVKDYTKALLTGTHTGLLLFGAGGNGKSYSIRETLDDLKIKEVQPEDTNASEDDDYDEDDDGTMPEPKKEFGYDTWVNHQGRITPKGLIEQMARFPQSLHLIEDAETMFDDKNCWGVLRMALHSQDHNLHSRRRITWKTSSAKGSFDFWFTGSLAVVGNRVLQKDVAEIDAVKTRCPCVDFNITNAELTAKMKELCNNGYRKIPSAELTINECYDVLEFVLTSIENDPELKMDARGKEKKLNLRILISGFRFMALGKMEPTIKWRSLLLSQLKQQIGAVKLTRAARIHDEKKLAADLATKAKAEKWSQEKKLVEWCKLVGKSIAWSDEPKDSPAYKTGFNTSKSDFQRKSK